MKYSFSVIKSVKRLTPPFLRNAFSLSWLQVLLTPVENLNNDFLDFIDETRINLSYNSQTLMFENLLNNKFDALQRRIKIENSEEEKIFLYYKSEGQTARFLYFKTGDTIFSGATQLYLKNRGESISSFLNVDFKVFIPSSLSGNTNQITGVVNRYRLAGKTFSISYS